MKFIIAMIKPEKLDAVRDALTEIAPIGMTVTNVKGYGRQRGHKEIYRGTEYDVQFTLKLKLEIAVDDAMATSVMNAIREAAISDRIGDGKIFVLDLEEAVRIRTGESGPNAL